MATIVLAPSGGNLSQDGDAAILTSGGNMATKTVNFTLQVTASPDWFLAVNPTTLSVAQGTAAVFGVTATAQGGYVGTIALSLSGLPAGVTPTINPTSIAQNGTATITIPTAAIPVGTVALTLTGVGS
jgi:hypothetical protein